MKEEHMLSPMPKMNDVKIMRYRLGYVEGPKISSYIEPNLSREKLNLVESQQSMESCEIDDDENVPEFAGG